MLAGHQSICLVISGSPDLLEAIEPVLRRMGMRIRAEGLTEDALRGLKGQTLPSLVLLDADLLGTEPDQFPAGLEAGLEGCGSPVVLLSANITPQLVRLVAEGKAADLIPRASSPLYWQLRLEAVKRAFGGASPGEGAPNRGATSPRMDPLTGIYNQEELLSLLFRETDRVQRMKTSLSLIVFGLDGDLRGGSGARMPGREDLIVQVVRRVQRLLRSYDLFGRIGNDRFLLGLPGCSRVHAVRFAERVRAEVFVPPFCERGETVQVTACFGIATSQGRSPVVVLREAEETLQLARADGTLSIRCANGGLAQEEPILCLAPSAGDDMLSW